MHWLILLVFAPMVISIALFVFLVGLICCIYLCSLFLGGLGYLLKNEEWTQKAIYGERLVSELSKLIDSETHLITWPKDSES